MDERERAHSRNKQTGGERTNGGRKNERREKERTGKERTHGTTNKRKRAKKKK